MLGVTWYIDCTPSFGGGKFLFICQYVYPKHSILLILMVPTVAYNFSASSSISIWHDLKLSHPRHLYILSYKSQRCQCWSVCNSAYHGPCKERKKAHVSLPLSHLAPLPLVRRCKEAHEPSNVYNTRISRGSQNLQHDNIHFQTNFHILDVL